MSQYLSLCQLFFLFGGVRTLRVNTRVSGNRAFSPFKGLHFIRVQKTGGTTFGAWVMPQFCKGHCAGGNHLDWNHVDHNLNIMTMLRDPVERTLSEFFFIRTNDGKRCSRQDQWNFNNNTWLQYVQEEPNVDDALEVYLYGYPRNPSINRQSMYVLGFDEQKQAGEKYAWKQNHGSLVEQVKAHLDNTTVFGITDCYEKSMQVIAKKLGWPVDETLKVAKKQWSRHQDKAQASSLLQRRKPLTPMLENKKLADSQTLKWRDVVHPEIAHRIQEQNAVDMQLFDYARQRFGERFGIAC